MAINNLIAQGFNPGEGLVQAAKIRNDLQQRQFLNALAMRKQDMAEHGLRSGGQMGGGIGTYNPRDYTPESLKQFIDGNMRDPSVLVRYADPLLAKIAGVQNLVNRSGGMGTVQPLGTLGAEAGAERMLAAAKKQGEQSIRAETEPSIQADIETRKGEAKRKQEKIAAFPKDRASLEAFKSKSDFIKRQLNIARAMTNSLTTGYGAVLKNWPASASKALANVLDTIRANVGFTQLQEMRENSKTGGALGQVSEMENKLLQAVLGSLDQSQGVEDLMRSYDQIEDQFGKSAARLDDAFNTSYSGMTKGAEKVKQSNTSMSDQEYEARKRALLGQ